MFAGRHAPDVAGQLEGLPQGKVEPQRRALAEYDADAGGQPAALGHRDEPADVNVAPAGHKDAGEHLQRGRFAGAVGTQVAEQFAPANGQVHPVDSGHGVPRPPEPAALAGKDELLAQPDGLDDVHDPVLR